MYIFIFTLILMGVMNNDHSLSASSKSPQLEKSLQEVMCRSQAYTQFYEIPEGLDLFEITDKILASEWTLAPQKEAIRSPPRRIFLFTYPSEGLKIKGFISFVPDAKNQPLLITLRGGTQIFGIRNPGSDLAVPSTFTVICTTYRGGISEGNDEFGGEDVNDVKNLVNYIPILEHKLQQKLHNDTFYMLGDSRGGMELFLALARFPDLQSKVSKVVALSGLLDMRLLIQSRPDMLEMFTESFGLIPGVNEDEWINRRDPMLIVSKIRQNLPILILQGLKDLQVSPDIGYSMVEALENTRHDITYYEVENGDHCLANQPDRMKLILKWLEGSS